MADVEAILASFDSLTEKIKEDIKSTEQTRFVFDERGENALTRDILNRVGELEERISEFGYKVAIEENLDVKDLTQDKKYLIFIMDKNGSSVTVDFFEYRNTMLDYTKSEETFIENCVERISGIGIKNIKEITKTICDYLSYVIHFKSLYIKTYENIGWDVYDGERIFKYDVIYRKPDLIEIESSEEDRTFDYSKTILKGSCRADYRDALSSRDDECRSDEDFMLDFSYKAEDAKRLLNIYDLQIRYADQKEVCEWIESFCGLMTDKPYAELVIAAACTGLIRPLISFTKETNINLNIVGDRATGKSTISHLALSLFGNPEALEGSFVDSEGAAELERVKKPVIPYFIDDRLLRVEDEGEKKKKREILLNIFREYEGKVSGRLAGKGANMSGERTYAPVISSSVESMLDSLLSYGRDLGQYRRFIEITVKGNDLFDDADHAKQAEKIAYTQYGYGVSLIVNYILSKDDNYVDELYSRLEDEISDILKEIDKDLMSSAKRFALIVTSFVILEESMSDFYNSSEGQQLAIGHDYSSDGNIIFNNQDKKLIGTLIRNLQTKMAKAKEAEKNVKIVAATLKKTSEKIDAYANILKFVSNRPSLIAKREKNYAEDKIGICFSIAGRKYDNTLESGWERLIFPVSTSAALMVLRYSISDKSDEEVINEARRQTNNGGSDESLVNQLASMIKEEDSLKISIDSYKSGKNIKYVVIDYLRPDNTVEQGE